MSRISILLFALLFSVNSFAIEHTFKFQINSSGPMIYACNAGIRHVLPGIPQVCYLSGSAMGPTTTCSPGTPNCVCTGLAGGATSTDYIRYRTGPFDGALNTPVLKTFAAESGDFAVARPVNQMGTRLDELTVNLSSERYGAEFFVDVCYHGPQIEYWQDQANVTMALKASLTLTDHNAAFNYRTLAGLRAQYSMACDTQGHGALQFARNAGGVYNTFDTEVNILGGPGNGFFGTTGFTFLGSNIWNLFSGPGYILVNNNPRAPRFCVSRFTFLEGNQNNVRRWQEHGAQASIFTSIEEL